MVGNDVVRTSAGALAFGVHGGEHNYARGNGTPAWVADVRAGQRLRVDLRVRPEFPQDYDDVAFFQLARDFWHTDLEFGQAGSDMLVWLRRPGSDVNGYPTFYLQDAFAPGRWTSVRFVLAGGRLRIAVNGTVGIDTRLPADWGRTWSDARLALGDSVRGGRAWHGQISRAEVRTRDHQVDYIAPGALAIPDRYFYLPQHVAPFPPVSREEWLILLLHLLSFVPIGFLIGYARRPRVRPLPAALVALGIALALAAGKFLFHERHMAVADLVVQFTGALLGAWVAWRSRRATASAP